MYYKPKHFREEEWFSPAVMAQNDTSRIWRLVDYRILWTMDALREYFGVPVTMNDYLWGGGNKYRGFRSYDELVDTVYLRKTGVIRPKFSSFTSQHTLGRAADSKFRNIPAEEIRNDIRANPDAIRYQYITAVEDEVSWLHIDVRNWETTTSGILFFNP